MAIFSKIDHLAIFIIRKTNVNMMFDQSKKRGSNLNKISDLKPITTSI